MAKYLTQSGGGFAEAQTESTGGSGGASGKIPHLDANGRLPATMMPTGIAADTEVITASEALNAGDFVNIWNSSGARARKADASTSGKEAHGFVLVAVDAATAATVYFEASNDQVTAMTPGPVFLSATTPGAATSVAPSGAGQIVQRLGVAVSATKINISVGPAILLA